jgi:hypothetical protein
MYSEMIGKLIRPKLQELVFINEVFQFSTLKLKLYHNQKDAFDDDTFSQCCKLREKSLEILTQYMNQRFLKLNQTGKK